MSQYYYNLIEDEKEARKERAGMRLAICLIIIGSLFIWMNWRKRE
jgi:hypothetical protein